MKNPNHNNHIRVIFTAGPACTSETNLNVLVPLLGGTWVDLATRKNGRRGGKMHSLHGDLPENTNNEQQISTYYSKLESEIYVTHT